MNIRSITFVAVLGAAAVAGSWWVSADFHGVASTGAKPVAVAPSVRPLPASAEPAAPARPLALVDDIKARLRAAAMKHPDPVDREAFLQRAVRSVPRALYAQLAEALADAAPRSVEAELLRAVLLRWAWEEPANAADWAADQANHPYRKEALALAAQGWARLDPAQLLQWAADLPAADREWVLLRSGDFLGRTDPALFAVWQQAIPPGRERDQLQLAIAREWALRDPENLAAALAENTGPEFDDWRQLTIAGLLTSLASMNGPAAARFVGDKIPPGLAQTQAIMGAIVAWARQDPVAASQWVERFPAEDLRVQASQVLLGCWLQQDFAAAQAYAQSLPAGPAADGANEQVAQFLAAKNGHAAVPWAERIVDPERRQRTLAFVLAETSRRDPEGLRLLLHRRPELAPAAPAPEG